MDPGATRICAWPEGGTGALGLALELGGDVAEGAQLIEEGLSTPI